MIKLVATTFDPRRKFYDLYFTLSPRKSRFANSTNKIKNRWKNLDGQLTLPKICQFLPAELLTLSVCKTAYAQRCTWEDPSGSSAPEKGHSHLKSLCNGMMVDASHDLSAKSGQIFCVILLDKWLNFTDKWTRISWPDQVTNDRLEFQTDFSRGEC